MFDSLIPLLPLLVPIAFVLWHALHRRDCPDCHARLPILDSPFRKTRRMWRAGGYLCARCGCETDMAGRKVTAGTAMPPFPARQWVIVGVLLSIGIGLGVTLWSAGGHLIAPPEAVAPAPVVAVPQQPPRLDN